MVIFCFICSLLFCITLVSFVIGMIVSVIKAKKNYNNLSNMLDNLNTIPAKLDLGDNYDKYKKE